MKTLMRPGNRYIEVRTKFMRKLYMLSMIGTIVTAILIGKTSTIMLKIENNAHRAFFFFRRLLCHDYSTRTKLKSDKKISKITNQALSTE